MKIGIGVMTMNPLNEHEEWLARRRSGIGASDAACILGLNPWKSNLELWLEKTGQVEPPDISDKPVVRYGNDAEPLLRELFALDYPDYTIYYDQYGMFRHPEHPWLFATLDGWFDTPDGRRGVLEIKTTEIMQARQWASWKDCIPDHYYVQVLHQLLATRFDLAILSAQIKYKHRGMPHTSTKRYMVDPQEEQVQADMAQVLSKETAFWKSVQKNEQPAKILPVI